MKKVTEILLICLGIFLFLVVAWFFFIALPVIAILGLIIFLVVTIKNTEIIKKAKKKLKKEKIKEAIIIEEED